MKKMLFASVFFLLGNLSVGRAQVNAPPLPAADTSNASPDFSATPLSKATLLDSLAITRSFAQPLVSASGFLSTPAVSTALSAEPAPANPPDPSPQPKFIYGGRDDYRWQLAIGAAGSLFRSNVLNASGVGVKTSVSYFLNDWLGVEGSFTGTWAPAINKNQDVKLATYGGGPKIAWRQRRWEPWLHGIFGGAHLNPQLAAGSRSSYAIMAGGGADYRWTPRISFRVEGDYVRTGFYHQGQNNGQLAGGIVFHF